MDLGFLFHFSRASPRAIWFPYPNRRFLKCNSPSTPSLRLRLGLGPFPFYYFYGYGFHGVLVPLRLPSWFERFLSHVNLRTSFPLQLQTFLHPS